MVASASLPIRTRGISSAAPAAGQTSATGATRLGAAMKERRVKSAAVGSSSKNAGRASLSSLAVTQRAPPPRSDNHPRADPRAGRRVLGSSAGPSSPMEWNRDWGGDGTELSRAPARAAPDATTATGEVERGSPGSHADTAMAVHSDGAGGGEKAGEAEERHQTAVSDKPRETEAAPATGRKHLRPCPFAGILDMSEPPLRSHRRSYYNEDDGKVYLVPQLGDKSTAAGVEEPLREEERFKCIVDFKGDVRHAEDCVLREVAHETPPQRKRNSFASEGHSGQEAPLQAALSAAIPVRMWHKESTSEWAPSGVGATGGRVTG